jgi:hypothetical protein
MRQFGQVAEMPKYHFDIRIGDCFIRDSEGSELADDRAALDYAREEIRELLMTRAGSKIDAEEARVEVGDQGNRLLFIVPFREAVASDATSEP